MSELGTSELNSPPQPDPVVGYISALIVFLVIAAFTYLFGNEIWHCWKPPVPSWILALHNLLNALATLVGGVVAVSFALKPPAKPTAVRKLRVLLKANLGSLGHLFAPTGREKLKAVLGAIYAIAYVVLGFAAIGTWAYKGGTATTPDVKNLASTFAGMIPPIVVAFFSS